MVKKSAQNDDYAERNRAKLTELAMAAQIVTPLLATLGGGIDLFLLGSFYPFKSSLILLADIGIGYWQGKLLKTYILRQATNPSGFAGNLFSVLLRGAATGAAVGLVNMLIMADPDKWLATGGIGGNVLILSTFIGFLLGAGVGLMIGVIFAAYVACLRLETGAERAGL